MGVALACDARVLSLISLSRNPNGKQGTIMVENSNSQNPKRNKNIQLETENKHECFPIKQRYRYQIVL